MKNNNFGQPGSLSENDDAVSSGEEGSAEKFGPVEGSGAAGFAGDAVDNILQEVIDAERENALNDGCDRFFVLKDGLCEQVPLSNELMEAFVEVRRGYPDQPMAEQCQGAEFRKYSDRIISAIAEKTLEGVDSARVVVLMPWRSGLAFARPYRERGVNRFYHLSSKRDEHTLQTLVDYRDGEVKKDDIVVIADPMLATGNTAMDAVGRIMADGVPAENIIVNAVVAAPVGVQSVKKHPDIKVILGCLDLKLDHRGYIVPGLGDFGDKYFTDFSLEQFGEMADALDLDDETRRKMEERFFGVKEVK